MRCMLVASVTALVVLAGGSQVKLGGAKRFKERPLALLPVAERRAPSGVVVEQASGYFKVCR